MRLWSDNWFRTSLIIFFVSYLLCFGAGPVAFAQSQIKTQELYLEAYINDIPTNLIGRFVIDAEGKVQANAQELRNIGIETENLSPDPNGDILVNQLVGISFRIDHPTQTIYFEAVEAARATKVIDSRNLESAVTKIPAPSLDIEKNKVIKQDLSFIMNYSFQAETDLSALGTDESFSANFGSRLSTTAGVLNFNFSYTDVLGYRRSDTFWRTPFAEKDIQLQFGDLISRGPNWVRPVRLGGIQIEKNFALRPDIVRTALPTYSGTAAVPTTVDVFDGSLRRLSTEVPAGPFELVNLPFSSGVNEATVMLEDASGQKVKESLVFVVSPDLLAQDTADYSLSLGYPRLGSGTSNDQYLDSLFGVATIKYGYSNNTTIFAHAEGGNGLALAGVGGTFKLGTLGTVGLSYAHSNSENGSGALVEASTRLQKGRVSLSGRMLRADDSFTDIARYTSQESEANSVFDFTTSTKVDQISVGFSGGGRWNGLQAVYSKNERLDGTNTESLSLTSSFKVGEASSINLTALSIEGDVNETLIGASIFVPLGKNKFASASAQSRGGQNITSASLAKRSALQKQDWDWRLTAVKDTQTRVTGRVGKQFQTGRVEIAASADENNARVGLRAEGSLVVAGGSLFLSERIDDAFAIVDVGAPNVGVNIENRTVGKTGNSGKILIPGLRGYETASVRIDVDDLPLDADVQSVTQPVSPSYSSGVIVDFAVDTNPESALLYLKLPSGDPVPVGLSAILESNQSSHIVGYDGMVYVRGLGDENILQVTSVDGWTCKASFTYKRQPDQLTDLGDVICN